MNAVDLILEDHQHIRTLFPKALERAKEPFDREEPLYVELQQLLFKHEKMEQTLFYPEIRGNDELSDIIDHLITEEEEADNLLSDLSSTTDGDEFLKKLTLLNEKIEHHATEEETKLFPKVRMLISNETLNKIGKNMSDYKETIYKEKPSKRSAS